MFGTVVETLNTLNEKGLPYKAEDRNGKMILRFGLLVAGKKNVVELTPNDQDKKVEIIGLGKNKAIESAEFAEFVDQLLKLKALQKETEKLEAVLTA